MVTGGKSSLNIGINKFEVQRRNITTSLHRIVFSLNKNTPSVANLIFAFLTLLISFSIKFHRLAEFEKI